MKAFLVEVSVAVVLGALSVSEGIRLVLVKKLHHYDILGPGFYNIGLGAVLIIVSFVYFASERKKVFRIKAKPAEGNSSEKSEYRKMMNMIAVMILYIALIYLAGYLFATLVFFFLINRIAGFQSWRTVAGASFLMTASFYLLFVKWMGIIFPRGLIFNF